MMSGKPSDPNDPYPSVRGALLLTMLAMLAAGFTGIAFIDFGLLAAVGIGQAIGVGAVATMGAQRVPEPQARRLGLRGLDPESIPLILCLIPAVLLASEIDNIAVDFSGGEPGITASSTLEGGSRESDEWRLESGAASSDDERADAYDIPDPIESLYDDPFASNYDQVDQDDLFDGRDDYDDERATDRPEQPDQQKAPDAQEKPARLIDPDDPASVFQAFIVMVGISPIVDEFLFRGVIQQGIVQRLGLIRGVSVVALLWTLLRPAPMEGFSRFLAAVIASFALGWGLGIVRIATRSILGPILLASTWAAIGLSAVVLEGRVDLPGLNVHGTHLPILVTLASALLVSWAGRTFFEEAVRRFEEGDGEEAGEGGGAEPPRPI